MIRLITALAILTLLACDNTTGGTAFTGDSGVTVESGDTLYIVSSYPVVYKQHKGGDSIGGLMHTVQQKHLDENNGFELTKMTERNEGQGWTVTAFPKVDGETQNLGYIETLTAPKNRAYYYSLDDSVWITISQNDVLDSMEVKGVWE